MEELRILDLKLKNALPDFDESDGYSLARKNLMIEERRMQLREAHAWVEKTRKIPHEYVYRLENLYHLKLRYTEKTRNELLNEKISFLEKLIL